jgi:hypothetical protein
MSPSGNNHDFDLYTAIGEIRSDVKTLLKNNDGLDKRVGWLEKKYWIAMGSASVVFMFVPAAVAKALGYF